MEPIIKGRSNSRRQQGEFAGINQRAKIDNREFTHMTNMSSDMFPSLTPRMSRENVCTVPYSNAVLTSPKEEDAIKHLTSFSGAADNKFYYNGELKGALDEHDRVRTIVDFYGKICIFPDKKYYSYIDDEFGSMERGYTTAVTVSFYSATDAKTEVITNRITKSGGWGGYFKSGDSIVITDCPTVENNTVVIDSRFERANENDILSVIVESVSGNEMKVNCYNKNGRKVKFTSKTSVTAKIFIAIPDISHICIHNNRLWGAAENGEFIYASKLGDPFNWNTFSGLSTDSWYGGIGTQGRFTGIASFHNAVVAFKEGYIHHVYGDKPQNYSIPKQINRGCIDGRSIISIGSQLYFLGSDGFYVYTGGEPTHISHKLSNNYTMGVAGTDGRKYYCCVNNKEMFVFDPFYNTWHREDDINVSSFTYYRGGLYFAHDTNVYKVNSGGESVEWEVTSKYITDDSFLNKGANNLYIRADMEADSYINVYVGSDKEKDFTLCGTVKHEGLSCQRIPIKFCNCDSYQIKLAGQGKVIVHDVEYVSAPGGRYENKYK